MKKLFGVLITSVLLIPLMTVSLGESYVMHTVQEGETYWKLSNAYSQNVDGLLALNGVKDPAIDSGDFLKVKSLGKNIDIFVNGTKLSPDTSPYLENNRTFVPIRFISETLNATAEWDATTSTAIITSGEKTIKLPVGSEIATVNGVPHQVDAPVKLFNGRVFIPIRFVSEILECQVGWDGEKYAVILTTDSSQPVTASLSKSAYTSEDLYWLSRIVSAEAGGESYAGKLAVANVIINRKASSDYPDTIKGVIFDRKFSVQFTPIQNGSIYNTPSQESIQAATDALEGTNNIGSSLFFLNQNKSVLNWIQTNRTYYGSIGNHTFYL